MRFSMHASLVTFLAACQGGTIGVGEGDEDGDGYSDDDCDDGDASVNPGATETWYDGVDQDCSGGSDYDQDGDSYDGIQGGGLDCDDGDAAIHPGATDDRDVVDDDCDGLVDEDAVEPGDLLVTEVMANPIQVSDVYGEYIEVYNTSEMALDLVGWTFSSDDGNAFTVGASLVVAAGDYAVLGAESETAFNGGVAVDYKYDRTTFSLSEDSDSIFVGVGGRPIFDMSYNLSTWPLVDGAAFGLDPDSLTPSKAQQAAYWCVQSTPLVSGDFGTPGGPNDWCSSVDHDGDGQSPDGGDCDDADPSTYTGAPEEWNGVDDDCDGQVDDLVSSEVADGYLDGASTYEYLGASLGTGDIDGDGETELLVGSSYGYYGRVYSVPRSGYASYAGAITNYDEMNVTGQYYNSLSAVGPRMADNLGSNGVDLVVGGSDYYAGHAWLVFEGPVAPSALDYTDATLAASGYESAWYSRVISHVDLNGDGVAEVLFGSYYTSPGGAYDYRGVFTVHDTSGLTGTTDPLAADWYLVGNSFMYGSTPYGGAIGSALAGDDLDGDGYDDAVVGATYYDATFGGAAYFLHGLATLGVRRGTADSYAEAILIGDNWDYFGSGVHPVIGDFDSDGSADIAIGTGYYGGTMYTFFDAGSLSGTASASDAADLSIVGSGSYDYFGASSGGGDFDGNGTDDLAIGASYSSTRSHVYLYGGETLLAGTYTTGDASAVLTAEGNYDYFGNRILGLDLDGTGADDLAIAAPYAAGYYGRVYLMAGL